MPPNAGASESLVPNVSCDAACKPGEQRRLPAITTSSSNQIIALINKTMAEVWEEYGSAQEAEQRKQAVQQREDLKLLHNQELKRIRTEEAEKTAKMKSERDVLQHKYDDSQRELKRVKTNMEQVQKEQERKRQELIKILQN
jgi:hypothetical protein